MAANHGLISERFPRSSRYHPEWISAGGGANALRLTEWLASTLDVRPGMRVLDLGCGRAASSIFLYRELECRSGPGALRRGAWLRTPWDSGLHFTVNMPGGQEPHKRRRPPLTVPGQRDDSRGRSAFRR